jgi:hypothetical protein
LHFGCRISFPHPLPALPRRIFVTAAGLFVPEVLFSVSFTFRSPLVRRLTTRAWYTHQHRFVLEGAWRLDVRIATLSAILNQEQEQAD